MKTLAAVLTSLLILAFFGCTESLVNQPEATSNISSDKTASTVNGTSTQVNNNEIKLSYNLYDPVTGDCTINGKITYTHSVLGYTGGIATVEYKLEMDAELCTKLMNSKKYQIYGNHSDVVYVGETGAVIAEKNYQIQHRPYLRLGVQYKVTTSSIRIVRMVLHQIDS